MPTSKAEFERLAEARLEEARCLYRNGLCDGAYYLAGYAVECAFKAVYCTRFGADELPDKEAVLEGYTHSLSKLVRLCGIASEIGSPGSPRQNNWAIVVEWTETSRYSARTNGEASDLIAAIDDPTNGILAWLRSKW